MLRKLLYKNKFQIILVALDLATIFLLIYFPSLTTPFPNMIKIHNIDYVISQHEIPSGYKLLARKHNYIYIVNAEIQR